MGDSVNIGTMTTGEGPLRPESARFEAESWAFFYVLGEFLRELQRALEEEEAAGRRETLESL